MPTLTTTTVTSKLPKVPTVTLPTVSLPTVTLPTVSLPTVTLPKVAVPTVKLPAGLDLDEAKKPALAVVGVLELSLEQARELPAEAKKLQDKLQAGLEAARTARAAQLKTVPAQLKELRSELETRVTKAQAGTVQKATAYYGELATRGEKLIAQVRRQPATESAIAEGKAAVKKAESATASAKKSTASAKKAAPKAG